MKNIPRIFVGDNVQTGDVLPATSDILHYLTRVMRRIDFLAFGGGREFNATLNANNIIIGEQTAHADPTYDTELYFAPIKRTDDLVNMATQMGVRGLHPVITEHTVTEHINWDRMRKIAIEAAEQSNRNSIPIIYEPISFSKLDLSVMCFADERFAYDDKKPDVSVSGMTKVLVGPEGGFSNAEFAALDAAGAKPVSLGRTILRAELAAALALGILRK